MYVLLKYHSKHEDEDIKAQSQQVWHKSPKLHLSEVQIIIILPFCLISISEISTMFLKQKSYLYSIDEWIDTWAELVTLKE